MWPRRRFLHAFGAIGSLAAWPAAAQFRVEISGVGATQLPLVVAAFRNDDKAPVAIADVVRADLQRSGLFRPSDSPMPLDERSRIVGSEWRARGADAQGVLTLRDLVP